MLILISGKIILSLLIVYIIYQFISILIEMKKEVEPKNEYEESSTESSTEKIDEIQLIKEEDENLKEASDNSLKTETIQEIQELISEKEFFVANDSDEDCIDEDYTVDEDSLMNNNVASAIISMAEEKISIGLEPKNKDFEKKVFNKIL